MFIEEQIEELVKAGDSAGLSRMKSGIEEAIDVVSERIEKALDRGRTPNHGDRLALKEAQEKLVTIESQISKVGRLAHI